MVKKTVESVNVNTCCNERIEQIKAGQAGQGAARPGEAWQGLARLGMAYKYKNERGKA